MPRQLLLLQSLSSYAESEAQNHLPVSEVIR